MAQQPAPQNVKEKKETPKQNSDLKTVKMTIELLASAHDIFEGLLDPQRVQMWTRTKAQISKQPGSPFNLFDGTITGEIINTVVDKKIEQKWRLKDWPQGMFPFLHPQHRLAPLLQTSSFSSSRSFFYCDHGA